MRWLRAAILVLVMLIVLATINTEVGAAPADESIRWLQDADLTQAATGARLRYMGSAQICAQASYVTYRRSDAEPNIVDQWYLVSQLWADAVLLAAPEAATVVALGGDAADRCHLD